jgi:hypothetical protein
MLRRCPLYDYLDYIILGADYVKFIREGIPAEASNPGKQAFALLAFSGIIFAIIFNVAKGRLQRWSVYYGILTVPHFTAGKRYDLRSLIMARLAGE